MTVAVRSFVAIALPALVLSSVGCSTLGRGGKSCPSCNSNQVYAAPSYIDNSAGGSGPLYTPPPSQLSPIPVPPAELPDAPVPPPPTGAARPSMIQRMQGSTTAFFLNANENVRRAFR